VLAATEQDLAATEQDLAATEQDLAAGRLFLAVCPEAGSQVAGSTAGWRRACSRRSPGFSGG
jgi:hypothetical protein